ncbi:MAG: hypothetical protein ACI9W6_001917 [Motiliproteus sp.]
MVDHLNPSRPPPPIEAISTLQRLDALLASGLPRTAKVVQIGPQLSTNPASSGRPATATTAAGASVTTPAAAATPAINPTSLPVTQAETYKVQIRLEGRLYELLTSKSLEPGSSVQISRGADQRILIQSSATPSSTMPSAQQGSGTPAAPNTHIERVAMPTSEQVRMGPGERLNALVISVRINPAMQQSPLAASLPRSAPTAALQTDAGGYQVRVALPQGNTLEFTSPGLLPSGTQVQLVRDNAGKLWAELPTAQTRAIEQALREHLPQQQPPSALLNLLSDAQASGQLQQAKPLLLNLFQILLGRSLTRPQQTDAASVKQQVQNSGTLLETKLAQNNTQGINLDLKAILLKVSRSLTAGQQRELPAALSERISALTQQALSRVLVNQITSLSTQTQDAANEQNRTLVLDIPVAWHGKTENLQLKIQRDPKGEDEATATMRYRWQVRLNFDVDEHRLLEAELTLEADQISILWSGDPELRLQIEAHLDQLQQRLESIGLKVKTLGVRERLPETESALKPPRSQLIDIKT